MTLQITDQSTAAGRLRDMDWYVRLGTIGTALFLLVTVSWATMAPLEGAVVAPGTVVLENNVSRLQHPTGGVVGRIMVKEGQRVQFGEVVLRLDETATRTNLQIIVNETVSVRARLARLRAERDGKPSLVLPEDLVARAQTEADVRQALASETTLFEARSRTRAGQRAQYQEQIKQLRQEIEGTNSQFRSFQTQLSVAQIELGDMRGLLARSLVQRPRVTQLEREVARIQGSLGELTSRSAQLRAKISEVELLIIQVDRALETEVAREIRENETKLGELAERFTVAEDQLNRIDLRTPREGIVHQLQVFNVGSVIQPGGVVMTIVPEQDTLVVEARVNPIDIDQLYPGQPARVRFSAFNNRTTPELTGQVYRIGADLTREERTGQSYYSVGIRIPDNERAKLGSLKLIPGMPAESFIKTNERTVASFLLKPIREHMNRAFREE